MRGMRWVTVVTCMDSLTESCRSSMRRGTGKASFMLERQAIMTDAGSEVLDGLGDGSGDLVHTLKE